MEGPVPLGDAKQQDEMRTLFRQGQVTASPKQEQQHQEQEEQREEEEEGEQGEEIGGPSGREPTRYGDWERAGRAIDF